MLLSKTVEVKLVSSTIEYYENLGYEIPRVYDEKRNRYTVKKGTTIIVKSEDVMKGSSTLYFEVKCDYCGKEYKKIVDKYYSHKNEYNSKDACDECKTKKSDETLMIKSGVNHNTQLESVKNNMSKARRKDEEIVIKLFSKKGLDIVNLEKFEYKNDRQDIDFICRKHKNEGIQNTTYMKLRQNNQAGCGCKYCRYEKITGDKCHLWNGGITDITRYLRGKIYYWKNETLEKYNSKCDITNTTSYIVVHHLYGFDQILRETMNELNLPIYDEINKYTDEELKLMEDKCLELHYKHKLGVCLCEEEHKKFHIMFGYGNNSPEQYYKYKEIRLKELNIKDLKVAN